MPPAWHKLPRLFVGAPDAFHRFWLKPGAPVRAGLDRETVYALSSDQNHHLRNVLRCSQGSHVRLFNGEDGEWIGIYDGKARVAVTEQLREQPRRDHVAITPDGPWLLFPVLKSQDRMQWLLEKATELGAAVLVPTLYARTQRSRSLEVPFSFDGSSVPLACQFLFNQAHKAYACPHKWCKWVVEAAEQCERLDVPVMTPVVPFTSLLDAMTSQQAANLHCELLVADEALARDGDGGCSSGAVYTCEGSPGLAIRMLAVGPEGGWSDEERASFSHHASMGRVRPVKLSNNVLRAETACIAGLALLDALRHSKPF